jgi:hypothetical protein
VWILLGYEGGCAETNGLMGFDNDVMAYDKNKSS